jgi:hypothetical protein
MRGDPLAPESHSRDRLEQEDPTRRWQLQEQKQARTSSFNSGYAAATCSGYRPLGKSKQVGFQDPPEIYYDRLLMY